MYKPIHRLLPFLCLIASISMYGQYTETINSNRPGESQGAFAVGTQVLQVESGVDFGNDTHSLLNTDIDITGFNLDLRYGFWKEALEINLLLCRAVIHLFKSLMDTHNLSLLEEISSQEILSTSKHLVLLG